MKWNIKRITGVISIICGLCWLCFPVFIIIKESNINNITDIFALISISCAGISIIVYVILTNFGIVDLKEIDKITIENKILKLQNEQKELKKKLTIE